jgi:hypothetical protein
VRACVRCVDTLEDHPSQPNHKSNCECQRSRSAIRTEVAILRIPLCHPIPPHPSERASESEAGPELFPRAPPRHAHSLRPIRHGPIEGEQEHPSPKTSPEWPANFCNMSLVFCVRSCEKVWSLHGRSIVAVYYVYSSH